MFDIITSLSVARLGSKTCFVNGPEEEVSGPSRHGRVQSRSKWSAKV